KPIETIRKRSKTLRAQDNPHDYKTGLLTTNSQLRSTNNLGSNPSYCEGEACPSPEPFNV
ncbi:MAG: hypothetical protein Q7V05_01915, partial [Methanoregula sp.]|nr:hypothetical protein [Methanoregula sp.]